MVRRLWWLPVGAYLAYAGWAGVLFFQGKLTVIWALGVVSLPSSLLAHAFHFASLRGEFIAMGVLGTMQYLIVGLLIRLAFT